MNVQYDPVLINGNEQDLIDFANSEAPSIFIVDWREEDAEIVGYANAQLPNGGMTGLYTDNPLDLKITYKGRKTMAGLTISLRDRMITVQAINHALQGDYEIRVFTWCLGTCDTYFLYLKPTFWWASMEEQFPERMASVFTKIADVVALEARPQPALTSPSDLPEVKLSPIVIFGGIFVLIAFLGMTIFGYFYSHDLFFLFLGPGLVGVILWGWKRDRLKSATYKGVPLYTELGRKRKHK